MLKRTFFSLLFILLITCNIYAEIDNKSINSQEKWIVVDNRIDYKVIVTLFDFFDGIKNNDTKKLMSVVDSEYPGYDIIINNGKKILEEGIKKLDNDGPSGGIYYLIFLTSGDDGGQYLITFIKANKTWKIQDIH